MDEIWQMLNDCHTEAMAKGTLHTRRSRQNIQWMEQLLGDMIEARLVGDESLRSRRKSLEQAVREGRLTPLTAAQQLLQMLWKADSK